MRRIAASILLTTVVACRQIREMQDVSNVASTLEARFNTPMGVTLSRGWLVISVPGVTLAKIPSADVHRNALIIAKFAFAHYPHPEAIQQVGVQFVRTRNRRGQVEYWPAGSWPVSRLRDTSVSPAPDSRPLGLATRAFEDTLLETVTGNGRTDTIGTMIQSLRRITAGPYAWWQQVVTYHLVRGGPDAVDSLRLDPATLLPILETRHNWRGLSRLAYEGPHVHGVLDSAATFTALDTTFEVAPFASAEIDGVLRAQPLDSGFVADLPFYYPGKPGFVWATARVVGADSATYIVESTSVAGVERFWISRSTHTLLAVRDIVDSAHRDTFTRIRRIPR
jgi:hypothetical protein